MIVVRPDIPLDAVHKRLKQKRRHFPPPFLLPLTPYFLWHLVQSAGALTLNAFVPSWQAPQNLPSFIAAMVSLSAPFFISNSLGVLWQSSHLNPLPACILPSKVTLPMGLANSTVFPGGTAMAFPIDSISAINTANIPAIFMLLSPFVVKNEKTPRIDAATDHRPGCAPVPPLIYCDLSIARCLPGKISSARRAHMLNVIKTRAQRLRL